MGAQLENRSDDTGMPWEGVVERLFSDGAKEKFWANNVQQDLDETMGKVREIMH